MSPTKSSASIASSLVETLNYENRPAVDIWLSFLDSINESARIGVFKVNKHKKFLILNALVSIKLGPEYTAWPEIVAFADEEIKTCMY